jgi:hypothetical protein
VRSPLGSPVICHEPTGQKLCAVCQRIVEHRSSWENIEQDGIPTWTVELKPCGHRFVTQAVFLYLAPERDAVRT